MPNLILDMRKFSKNITITVQYKNMFWVRVGMWFIKAGVALGGFTLVDEFPMSLIQSKAFEKSIAGMPVILDPRIPEDEIRLQREA